MISILIPIFNFNVHDLVHELRAQLLESAVPFEIICMDDHSNISFDHELLEQLSGIKYIALTQNIGRAAIRNKLAKYASYDHLLFLDCDGTIEKDFITTYLEAIKSSPDAVICGGRNYSEIKPDKKRLLHWTIGKQREEISANLRKKAPYQSFMTNNFVVPKSTLIEIGFNESIKDYGHEDSLFGFKLQSCGIEIHHIDNPAQHIDLEPAQTILNKTNKAVQNLWYLSKDFPMLYNIKLLRIFEKIRRFKLTFLITLADLIFSKGLIKNLLSNKPSLYVFDLYKLILLKRISDAEPH